MADSTRIFSFGLGSSPSRFLIKGLARATNGRYVFIPANSNIDVYVSEQLKTALQSCIRNVQVKWHLNGLVATTIPTIIPPLYARERLIVYALLDEKIAQFDQHASVQLITEQCRLAEAKLSQGAIVTSNETIARLAAKKLILELQHSKLPSSRSKKSGGSLQTRFQQWQPNESVRKDDHIAKDIIKKRIIELSLRYNILSPHTAFVGVEKRVKSSNAQMILREVPIQISIDHQHSDRQTLIDSRIVNALERRFGLDLNGDGYIGGEGYLSKLEHATGRDINGDGLLSRPERLTGFEYRETESASSYNKSFINVILPIQVWC
jgi:hypothetical protein